MEDNLKLNIDELLTKVKLRDDEAFNQLYDLSSKILFRLIYSYIKNKEDSEDVLSDTYYTIAKNIDKYKGKNGFNWIYTIAKNQALDFLKKRKKMVNIDPNDEETINTYNLSDNTNKKINNTYNEVLNVAKELLKPNELNILLLHLLDNMTFNEIKDVIGGKEATIRWQYNEILKKLRIEVERRNISYE